MTEGREPRQQKPKFEFGEWERALDDWTRADNEVYDLLEQWHEELKKVHESFAAWSAEEESAVLKLSQKYLPLLDAARKAADAAYDKFKEEQSRPLS